MRKSQVLTDNEGSYDVDHYEDHSEREHPRPPLPVVSGVEGGQDNGGEATARHGEEGEVGAQLWRQFLIYKFETFITSLKIQIHTFDKQ